MNGNQPLRDNSISSQPTALPSQSAPPAVVPRAAADTSRTLSNQDTAGGAGSPSSGGALPLDIERKIFAERFDLLEELGSGGMGRVLKAFDRKLQRAVAVKRIKGPLATDPDLLRRFLREAQFAARLNHPNVVTVHDILTDDEGPYLVLEFIDGESLAQRLQRGGAIPWREAIDLLLPICDAVTAAHAQGIIHRDIKPANIMLPKKGPPKLGDFGIARSLEGSDLTASGAVLGTLDYMAPEQMDSTKTFDERADVYSLAATLYHMVAGESPRPIDASNMPVEVREAVLSGLRRDTSRRTNTVADLWESLSLLLATKNRSSEVSTMIRPVDTQGSIDVNENLNRWIDSGHAERWVRGKSLSWGHEDWIALVMEIKESEYWPLSLDSLGEYIERLRDSLRNKTETQDHRSKARGIAVASLDDLGKVRRFHVQKFKWIAHDIGCALWLFVLMSGPLLLFGIVGGEASGFFFTALMFGSPILVVAFGMKACEYLAYKCVRFVEMRERGLVLCMDSQVTCLPYGSVVGLNEVKIKIANEEVRAICVTGSHGDKHIIEFYNEALFSDLKKIVEENRADGR